MSVGTRDDTAEAEVAVRGALATLGRDLPERHTDRAKGAALRVMCELLFSEKLTCQELAAWTHRVIGHQGPEIAQLLAALDDSYDCLPYTQGTEEDLDALVRAEAREIASEPAPPTSL